MPEKMRFENTQIPQLCFFKFCCDYDLNLCRCLNPELPAILQWYSIQRILATFFCTTVVHVARAYMYELVRARYNEWSVILSLSRAV